MIRPVESNMSLYTVDHKAHQAQNDPNTHTALAMQQAEALKKNDEQRNIVQKMENTEGDIKIRDKNSEGNKGDANKRRRKRNEDETQDGMNVAVSDDGKDAGRLDFLA